MAWSRKDYFNLRNLAWQFLIDNNYCELPINLEKNLNYIIYGVETIPGNQEAILYPFRNKLYILYNKNLPFPIARFRIAHEIGHAELKHYNLSKKEEEKEANMFAARILMPIIILKELNIKSPQEISSICNVSLIAATYRFSRLKILKTRNKFLYSPLEKQVLNNFKNYIKENKR